MNRRWIVAVLAGLGIVVGIAVAEQKMQLNQIPAKARAALKKLAGEDVTLGTVEVEKEHGMMLYEAEWKVNGKEVEAAVTADGDLVEMEEEISVEALPPRVKSVVAEQMPGGAKEAERITVVMYEVEGDGKELMIMPNGRIFKQKTDDDDDDGGNHGDDDDHDDDEHE